MLLLSGLALASARLKRLANAGALGQAESLSLRALGQRNAARRSRRSMATIGMLGIEGADHYAIDFEVRAIDDNVLWLAAGNGLYTVNVESGAATMESEFSGLDGTLRDIAILPAM